MSLRARHTVCTIFIGRSVESQSAKVSSGIQQDFDRTVRMRMLIGVFAEGI